MASRRFRTRKQWSNTVVWAIAAVLLVLASIALMGMTDKAYYFHGALVIAAIGTLVSLALDRKESLSYSVEGGQLLLRRKATVERMDLGLVLDASLVDRRAARDILNQRLATMVERGISKAERSRVQRDFLRWCTVDIGLGSLSFGIGRELVDRRPDGKYDLVLVRLRDGRALLLSPLHSHDLVDSMSRSMNKAVRTVGSA